jgi:hypothetical protein
MIKMINEQEITLLILFAFFIGVGVGAYIVTKKNVKKKRIK